mgnify:CR=1 FL=1
MKQRISIIIPAFNEEARIGNVIEPLFREKDFFEIIVIDDGSSDKTSEVAKGFFGVRVVKLDRNQGKGAAIIRGIEEARGDILVFIDADLVGLTKNHIRALVKPVADGGAEATLGVFRKDWKKIKEIIKQDLKDLKTLDINKIFLRKKRKFNRIFDVSHLAQIAAKGLSGQRAIKADLARLFPKSFSRTRFGIEIAINKFLKENKIIAKIVFLDDLTQVIKEKKSGGVLIGFGRRLRMYGQVIWTAIVFYLWKR